ncbi:hypothetical protein DTO96_102182 [Ephemeroptericola cinctiostellae]|uniref:Uncharacterized protein n=1 Tax=Ephemeroptericola cinctiostellae TaxID=2268024 RepID=A0A345DDJ0_9BURK|nr:putative holin [Ephemeroptericola cinctiostellae]AXF86428.1 hypothetical protein DTO96_102182 [Ephemeroptericola cinctiostellae]
MRDTLFHRTISFLVLAVFLLGVALLAEPQLFGVTVYKLGLVFASASAGYWIDRVTFPYARPDKVAEEHVDFSEPIPTTEDEHEGLIVGASLYSPLYGQTMLRRAVIMAACMICVGLGA